MWSVRLSNSAGTEPAGYCFLFTLFIFLQRLQVSIQYIYVHVYISHAHMGATIRSPKNSLFLMVIMKLAIGVSLQVSFKFPRVIGSPGNSIVQFLVDHQVARWTGWSWWHLMGRRCQDMEMIYLTDQLQWLLFWLKWPVFHDFDMYSCIAVLYYNMTWHTTWIKRNEEIQILWQKMITWGFIGIFMSCFSILS